MNGSNLVALVTTRAIAKRARTEEIAPLTFEEVATSADVHVATFPGQPVLMDDSEDDQAPGAGSIAQGEGAKYHKCSGQAGIIKRCWGCDHKLHAECAGGERWGPGPTHCNDCWEFFRRAGVREVVLDAALMP